PRARKGTGHPRDAGLVHGRHGRIDVSTRRPPGPALRPDDSSTATESDLALGGEPRRLRRAGAGHLAQWPQQDVAGLGAIGRAHHAVALHALDHPRGAVVADAHLSLEHRDAHLAHLAHYRQRLVVELVAQLVVHARVAQVLLARLEDRLVV